MKSYKLLPYLLLDTILFQVILKMGNWFIWFDPSSYMQIALSHTFLASSTVTWMCSDLFLPGVHIAFFAWQIRDRMMSPCLLCHFATTTSWAFSTQYNCCTSLFVYVNFIYNQWLCEHIYNYNNYTAFACVINVGNVTGAIVHIF